MKSLIVPCAVVLMGGSFCGSVDNPCDLDRYACDSGTQGFATDKTCQTTDELTLTIGTGEDAYEAIDGWPAVHSGSQGGHHIFAGLRVEGVESTAYDRIKMNVEVFVDDMGRGSRSMILRLSEATNLTSPTTVEDFGLLVFVQSVEPGTIKMSVTDPCGRSAHAEHVAPSAE